jgi:hypothetical protein
MTIHRAIEAIAGFEFVPTETIVAVLRGRCRPLGLAVNIDPVAPLESAEAVSAASAPNKRGPEETNEPAPAQASTGPSAEPIPTLDEVIAALNAYAAPRGGQLAGRQKMQEVCGVNRLQDIKPEDYGKLVAALNEAASSCAEDASGNDEISIEDRINHVLRVSSFDRRPDEVSLVDTMLDRLIRLCFDRPGQRGDNWDLGAWLGYQRGAKIASPDEGHALLLEAISFKVFSSNGLILVTLRRGGHEDIVWTLMVHCGTIVGMKGTSSCAEGATNDLANTIARYVRLIGDGSVTAKTIPYPADWYEAA